MRTVVVWALALDRRGARELSVLPEGIVSTPMGASDRIMSKAILPVARMSESITFYRRLGFEVRSYDPNYAFVINAGVEVCHLRVVDDLTDNAAAVFLHVPDAAVWHTRWGADGVPVEPLKDAPWGMREFSVTDPSGNLLRVGHNL